VIAIGLCCLTGAADVEPIVETVVMGTLKKNSPEKWISTAFYCDVPTSKMDRQPIISFSLPDTTAEVSMREVSPRAWTTV